MDFIPILKYVPEWFPGAKFQRKAAVMRKHAAIIRHTTFAATEKLVVCDSLAFLSYDIRSIRPQASGDYDPSFLTEALTEIQSSDTPNQDIDLMKDVAVQAYLG